MQRFLETCPGLVGDIARYVDSTLPVHQPAICLAAAFSFMSALLARRVNFIGPGGQKTEPSLFVVVVADSGTGKTNAQSTLAEIVTAAKMDTSRNGFLLGVPASDSGLLKALSNESRRLLIWDEMGISLGAYATTRSSHEAMILGTAMKLFSSAGRKYIGKEYATQDRIDIDEPYLSIFGASTNTRFFGALDQNLVEDGFVPRLLLFFEANERKEKASLPSPSKEAFDSIVERVRKIEAWQSQCIDGDLAAAVPHGMPKQKASCKFEPACSGKDMFSAWDYWEIEVQQAIANNLRGSITRLLYTRARELSIKVILCLAEFSDCSPLANSKAVDFGIDLTRELLNSACEQCGKHVYPNERTRTYAAAREKILGLIGVGESITKSALYRRTAHFADSRLRDEIINDLLDSEIWHEEVEKFEGSRKKSVTYTKIE